MFSLSFSADDADHELFSRFEHDVAQCVKALQFLGDQNERILSKYWPDLFECSLNVSGSLGQLMGENSLDFDEQGDFYARFDRRHAQSSELMTVHPKEKTFYVASLHDEITAYSEMTHALKEQVLALSSAFLRELNRKLLAIHIHLKHIQTRLKLRDSLHGKTTKLEQKVLKLEKKTLEIDLKNPGKFQAEYDEKLAKLALTKAKYTALNTKLKLTLPELLLLLEEFVSLLVKWLVCRQKEIAQIINENVMGIARFYGLLGHNANKSVPTFETIEEIWEAEATPTRLRVESLLQAIYEKHPDLIDEEISGKDHALGVKKAWLKLTSKAKEKHHKVKPKDRENGIFHDHLMADPLVSYLKFNDPAANMSETYHPSKIVSKMAISPDSEQSLLKMAPPPLPPRNESSIIQRNPADTNLPDLSMLSRSLFVPQTPPIGSSHAYKPSGASQVSSPAISKHETLKSPRLESQIHSQMESQVESQLSLASDEVETTISLVESAVAESTFFQDMAHEKLARLYNGLKNAITEAPVTKPFPQTLAHAPKLQLLLDPNNSSTLKLQVLRQFRQKLAEKDHKKRDMVLIRGFAGVEPGDLAFGPRENVSILFDLQLNIMTYDKSGENWVFGVIAGSEENPERAGFAPNTCF